jgi:hypothetical protein
MRYWLGAGALVLSCGIGAAEIKRWVDAEGRVHFGDQAPPSVEAEVQEIDDPEPAESGGGLRPGELEMLERYEQRGRDLEAAKQRSYREYEKGRLSAEQAQKRDARCDYYRHRLEHYRGKKRRGYSRTAGDSIDDQIELNEMKVELYCD